MTTSYLSTRLREHRKAQGWTLASIAGCTQTSVSFVSDLEHGRRKFALGNADAWASVLGLNVEDYLAAVLQERLAEAGFRHSVKVTKP